MAALSVAIEGTLAFAWVGDAYDNESFVMVRDALAVAPFDVYDVIVDGHWNYPPGFLLWIWPAGEIAEATGIAFHGLVQLPAIAANVAIAWLVQDFLGRKGLGPNRRLAAAALVLLGPVFVAIAGYHGQIDSVAILPAVAAFAIWERGGERRALAAGLLIGAGIAVKTAPGLLLLALLPNVRSPREAATLVVSAAAVPLAVLAPFLATDAKHAIAAIEYPSVGTAGGLGLISTTLPNPVVDWIRDLGTVWNAIWIGATAAVLFGFRPPPVRAATIVWLALFVFGTGFYLHYLVWGLPFLLLEGALVAAAAVQALTLAPLVVNYGGLFGSFVANRAFDIPMLALWAYFVWLLGVRVARATSGAGSTRPFRPAHRASLP
jgi:hypothetical protein